MRSKSCSSVFLDRSQSAISMNGPPSCKSPGFNYLDLIGPIRFHDKQGTISCEGDQPTWSPCGKTIFFLIVCQTDISGAICVHNMDLKFRPDPDFCRRVRIALGVKSDL